MAVRLRPPAHDGRCPAGRGASLEATYRVTPAGVRVAHLPHLADASRLVPAAALKAVGVRRCAFDPRRLRHAPLAEWLSTGLLTRGGQFDSDAAYHLPPVAQRTEHPGPNGTVARSNRARRTRPSVAQWTERPASTRARARSTRARGATPSAPDWTGSVLLMRTVEVQVLSAALRDGGAVVLGGLISHARAGSNPAPATFR